LYAPLIYYSRKEKSAGRKEQLRSRFREEKGRKRDRERKELLSKSREFPTV
jgi:hypothetical protein